LVTVMVQVIVLPPKVPALLHSEIPMFCALASVALPPTTVRPNATVRQKERRVPSEKRRIFEREVLFWIFTWLLSVGRDRICNREQHTGVQRSLQVATRHQLLSVDW